MNDLFSFDVDGLKIIIKEGEGLSVFGTANAGKSELLYNIFNRKKGVLYRGIVSRFSVEETALFNSEIGYYDGSLYGDPEEPVSILVSNSAHVFGVEPKQILNAFEIAPDDLKLKLKQADEWLNLKLGLLNELSKEYKLLFIDDVFGLDYGLKRRLVPMLLHIKKQLSMNFVIATNDVEFAGILTDKILVLHEGHMVEYGAVKAITETPMHPYTKWLMDSTKLVINRENRFFGDFDAKAGKKNCRFCHVCPYSSAECKSVVPPIKVTSTGSYCACNLKL